MSSHRFDESQVREYVLGGLSADVRQSFETRFLGSDEAMELLLRVEDELVEAYVRDELGPEERRRFRESFLVSEAHLRKVRFAESLLALGKAQPAAAPEAGTAPARRFHPHRWIGLAAVILISLYVWRAGPHRTGTEETPPPLRPNGTPAPRAAAADTPLPVGRPSGEGRHTPSPAVPAEVTVHRTADGIEVRLPAEAFGAHERHSVVIETDAGVVVVDTDRIVLASARRGGATSRTATVTVPEDKLPAGTYMAIIRGHGASGRPEELAQFLFHIEKD